MKERFFIVLLFSFLIFGCDKSGVEPDSNDSVIEKILTSYKKDYGLPSIAGGVIGNGQTQIYASGVRKMGTKNNVTENDAYYIGSNIKAMTATLTATLVEENLLSWNSTITEIFPEFAGTIPREYTKVTLTQLLNHHAGIMAFEFASDLLALPQFSGGIIEQRREFTRWVLNQSDKQMIGSFQYSNGGYVIAAAMAEKVTGKTWEELMDSRLLTPLGMSYFFDWPAEQGRNLPWGHTLEGDDYTPFNPDSSLQFPVLFNPAGNISLNMADYLKFIKLHLDGLNGTSTFLTKTTFEYLHTPVDNYSLGWGEGINPDTGLLVAFHEGSDDTFDAFVIMKPALNKGAAVFTNCGSEKTSEAIMLACIELIDKVN